MNMPTEIELEDTACSYDEWKNAGYFVKKGSKSKLRDMTGVPQFTADQVVKANDWSGRTHWDEIQRHESLWEKSAKAAKAKGTPWGVVEDFDSFVREAGMLPDLSNRPRFAINCPMERYFMNVADKHGILDAIIDGDEDDWY